MTPEVPLREYRPSDLDTLVALTVATFRPFYEDGVLPLYGPQLFEHQHGRWREEYAELVPTLHAPEDGRHVLVAGEDPVGYVAWSVDRPRRHGMIEILAVAVEQRRHGLARTLSLAALHAMRHDGVDVAGVFTGGDDFHVPARALYEALGGLRVEISGYLFDLREATNGTEHS